jgi:formate dehydrogenase major subunit
MGIVNITLNGKPVKANTDQTILEVARSRGITIPTLCNDERLKAYGSCRVCLVKVEGARNFVPSCSTQVSEGMVIDTEDEEIYEARRLSLALLISDHYGDCVSPCSLECPAHIDIQGYIALIRAGAYQEAVELIKERNPMPVTIGRVCPHPCEEVCRRSRVDEPIAINNLKRFAADYDIALEHPWIPERAAPTGKKVAVIGAGPAGISAAWYLAVWGHGVTIFEGRPEPGGMLRYGIPEYRLPKSVLDREIDLLFKLGAEIRYETALGRDVTFEGLRKEGYDAVFLAIGAQRSTDMRIEGEQSPGVLSGIDFLADMALGRRHELEGKTVIVVGGGNTAMDASRTALRLGADKVTILYRRTRNEMPAHDFEIREAEEEGVELRFLAAPIRVKRGTGKLSVECIRMELGPPDDSGRRRPVPLSGSEHQVEADLLITAIGQQPDITCLSNPELAGARDRIKADPLTGETPIEYVFAGGDCVTGAATAIEAIAAGRRAALSIDQFLRMGAVIKERVDLFNISKGSLEEIPDEIFALYQKSSRASMPTREPAVRAADFHQIEEGLTEEAAIHEAARCLECGCIEGFTCQLREHATAYHIPSDPFPGGTKNRYPEYNNMLRGHPPILRDENKCIKCGICVRICDEVWGLSIYGYIRRGFETEIAPSFGKNLEETACDFCGQCADACPTGALALNPYTPKPGPFKMTIRRGTCVLCSLGCAIDFNLSGDMLVQCTSEPGLGENEGNLCVRGRFGYRYLLPGNRTTDYLEFQSTKLGRITAETAVQRAAELLRENGQKTILTSTSLSNEEYHLIRVLGEKIGVDVFHIAHDPAERTFEPYAVAGSFMPAKTLADPASKLTDGLNTVDLSGLSSARTIVLFNTTPGRSFPILEMKIRHAAQRGVRLFIIHSRPTRLDEYAESVFRIGAKYYGDFLKLAGALRVSRENSAAEAVRDYFHDGGIDEDLLTTLCIKPSKIAAFAAALGERTVYITDEDTTNPEDVRAFHMHALIKREISQVLSLRRGTNPGGASTGTSHGDPAPALPDGSLLGELSAHHDTLMVYKLPQLFPLNCKRIIQIGFSPFEDYSGEGIFIPSSSLLETGGTTFRYNGSEISVQPVLENRAGLDNIRILEGIIRGI